MTRIEQIWTELENASGNSPLVMRGYGAEGHGEIYVTWNCKEQCRGFAVRLSVGNTSRFQGRQDLQDIALTLHTPYGQSKTCYVLVELKNNSHQGIFTTLSEDLIRSVAHIRDEDLLVQTLLNRLVQWESLFSRLGAHGLTPQAQRGLYGELRFLLQMLKSGQPLAASVDCWFGPFAAVQDFQLGGWAVEVKTTSGNNHQKIQISSNRQLDDTGLDSLFLYHISLDTRAGLKNTLNALINDVEILLSADLGALQTFKNKLQSGGYFEVHAPVYEAIGYIVRSEDSYQISTGFPRITEATTPEAVGDLKYSIIASYCAPWKVSWQTTMDNLKP